jgi:hypothetical protein
MNLDTLKTEIEGFLEAEGFAVFHGYSRVLETVPMVYWDCEHHPDYKEFVKAAKAAGAKVMVFHQRDFSIDQIDEALDQLETFDMPRDEHRTYERRLNELRTYEGFTCALELSFDHEGRVFLFDLRTEWYEDLSDILGELHMLEPDSEDEDDETMGGYFSKN